MIYGYDAALEMPTMEVYDSGLLGKYIDAAKEDYERGLAEQKEFATKYGDFTSLISKDVDWWDKNVTKPIQDFVSGASELGIDMRSPEFRSAYMRMVNKLPYAGMTQRKNQAKVAQKYSDSIDALKKAGLWNPDYEKFLLDGKNLDTWDTEADGAWTRSSAEPMTTLTDFAKKATEGMKPSYLRTSEDGLYDYTGITRDDVKAVLGRSMKDYLESNSGKYNLKLIADRDGLDLSNSAQRKTAEDLLQNEAADRSGRMFEEREPNKLKMLDIEHRNRLGEIVAEGKQQRATKAAPNYDDLHPRESTGGTKNSDALNTLTRNGGTVHDSAVNFTPRTNNTSYSKVNVSKEGVSTDYNEYALRPNRSTNDYSNCYIYYKDAKGNLKQIKQSDPGLKFVSGRKVTSVDGSTYLVGTLQSKKNGVWTDKDIPGAINNTAYLEVRVTGLSYEEDK